MHVAMNFKIYQHNKYFCRKTNLSIKMFTTIYCKRKYHAPEGFPIIISHSFDKKMKLLFQPFVLQSNNVLLVVKQQLAVGHTNFFCIAKPFYYLLQCILINLLQNSLLAHCTKRLQYSNCFWLRNLKKASKFTYLYPGVNRKGRWHGSRNTLQRHFAF